VTSEDLAREFLDRARKCLEEAKKHFDNPTFILDYPLSITRAHECVELSLKAACFWLE